MRFIKLSETIVDWEWFTDGNMLKLWIYLLVNAQQFGPTRYRGIELKTGQLVTGRKILSKATGLSEREVRTCINRLKATNEISVESTNQYSIITILKYDLYQSGMLYGGQQFGQQSDHRPSSDRPAGVHQSATSKRDKREREQEGNTDSVDCSPEFAEALEAFAEMRSKIRKPLTVRAKQMVLKKLSELAPDEITQIEILNQSTMNGWQGVFPLNNHNKDKVKGMVNVLDL